MIASMRRRAFTALAFVLSAACARSIETDADRLCTPGNYVFCRCKDRSEGTKLCGADGLSFGACDACNGTSEEVPVPPVPEEEVPDASEEEPDVVAPPPPPVDAAVGDATDDGAPVIVPKPAAGEVLITEVMYDPSGTEPDQEWIELLNTTTSPRLIDGLVLKDGGNRSHTIVGSPKLILAPKTYVILARNRAAATAAKVPAASIVYEYGANLTLTQGILLANSASGGISLLDGTTTVSAAFYGGWFMQMPPGGKSIQVKELTFASGGNQAAWCLSATVFGGGVDFGTPGAAKDCP